MPNDGSAHDAVASMCMAATAWPASHTLRYNVTRPAPDVRGRSRTVSRWVARAAGVGWSNTTVAGRLVSSTLLRRLRSSTAVSESKPSVANGRSGSRSAGDGWPSTAATASSTTSIVASLRALSVGRTGRSRPRSSGGTGSPGRSPPASSSMGASTGSGLDRAASNSASARVGLMGATIERRPVGSVMPSSVCHRPHARDTAGRPSARRCRARASRKAFAAA